MNLTQFKTDFKSAIKDVIEKHVKDFPSETLEIVLNEMFTACLGVICLVDRIHKAVKK